MGGAEVPRQVEGDRFEAQPHTSAIRPLLDAVEVGNARFVNHQHLGGGDVRRGGFRLHQDGAGHQTRLPCRVDVDEDLHRQFAGSGLHG